MPPMNLRWTIWGRPVKPVAFSLMVTMLILTVINVTDYGILTDHAAGDVLAGGALFTAGMLGYGWYMRSQMVAEIGLVCAFFVWTTRFCLGLMLAPITNEGIYLSLCWAVVAGGSYLLEKTDNKYDRGF